MVSEKKDAALELKEIAEAAITPLFWASMCLTALGFTILLGGLDLFLQGVASDNAMKIAAGIAAAVLCIALAFGFVKTEHAINLMWAVYGKVPPVALAGLILIFSTNLIVGVYRANTKTSADTYALSQQVSQEDFMIKDLLNQKDSIQVNVYHDGTPSNDAAAAKQISALNNKIEAREAKMVDVLKPVGDGTYNLFVICILGFLSVVFSTAIQIAYHDQRRAALIPETPGANGKYEHAPQNANTAKYAKKVDVSALLAKIAHAGIEREQFAQIVKSAVFETVRVGETKFFAKAARAINEEYDLDTHRDEIRVFFIQVTGLRNRGEIQNALQHEEQT